MVLSGLCAELVKGLGNLSELRENCMRNLGKGAVYLQSAGADSVAK